MKRMSSVLISFRLILCQRFRDLKFTERQKSGRTSLLDEEKVFIPKKPIPSPIDESKVEEPPPFDKALKVHLERLSLLRFCSELEFFDLKRVVRFANQLKLVDTKDIKPLKTLLEDVPCPLREDVVGNPMTKGEVLMNAAKTVEDYFVVPPGNIPLEESDKLNLAKVQDWDRKAMNKRNLWEDSEEKQGQ